jgi:2-isopropylmalate synthase
LEQEYGIQMPRWMQVDFSPYIQQHAEKSESEVAPADIHNIFYDTYLATQEALTIDNYHLDREANKDQLQVQIVGTNGSYTIDGQGKGVLDAFVRGLSASIDTSIVLIDYSEHALPNNKGAKSEQSDAMAYVQLSINGVRYCAAAKYDDIVGASLQAVLNAVMRSGANVALHSDTKLALV